MPSEISMLFFGILLVAAPVVGVAVFRPQTRTEHVIIGLMLWLVFWIAVLTW